MCLLLKGAKLLMRDSIYKLYINKYSVPLSKGCQTPLRDYIYKLYIILKVYLLLRDAKLLMRDSIASYT